MRRVLVDGGTGFIGMWVVKELVNAGWATRVFDLSPRTQNLEFVQPGLSNQVELISGDICDVDALSHAMQGCDCVVHLVGLMTRECALNPSRAIDVNLIGSQNVFTAAAKQGVRMVAYASSAAVYGPQSETIPNPMSLYGTLKLAVEGVARVALQEHGVSSAGFRPYIVYGPGESSGIAAGPSIALRAAARQEAAEIEFSGDVGFVHVLDVARAIMASLTQVESEAQKLDMGGDYASVRSFVERLQQVEEQSKVSIVGPPLRLPKKLAGGDVPTWFSQLPTTDIEQGITQTLDHWKAVDSSGVPEFSNDGVAGSVRS